MKLAIIGFGDVGKSVFHAMSKVFEDKKDLFQANPLQVTIINRNIKKATASYLDASLGGSKKFLPNLWSVKISDNYEDIKDAQVVIFTAGVSANSTGFKNRESALPLVDGLVSRGAEEIKKYAPGSFVLIITNPVDITTWIMQEKTGFPPERVLGFGCELDSRRFSRALWDGLDSIGIRVKYIEVDVLGGHSGSEMIVVENSIKIEGMTLLEFKSEHQDKIAEIDEVVKNADRIMREEGFEIVKGGGKAHIAPAVALANVAKSLLFGGEMSFLCSQVLTDARSAYGINGSCVSVPVVIDKSRVDLNPERCVLTETEYKKLSEVAGHHHSLLTDINGMNEEFKRKLEADFAMLNAERAAMAAQQRSFANVMHDIREQQKRSLMLTSSLFQYDSEGFSQVKIGLKEAFKSVVSSQHQLQFFEDMINFLNGSLGSVISEDEIKIDRDELCLVLPKKESVVNLLQDLGLHNGSASQTEGKGTRGRVNE